MRNRLAAILLSALALSACQKSEEAEKPAAAPKTVATVAPAPAQPMPELSAFFAALDEAEAAAGGPSSHRLYARIRVEGTLTPSDIGPLLRRATAEGWKSDDPQFKHLGEMIDANAEVLRQVSAGLERAPIYPRMKDLKAQLPDLSHAMRAAYLMLARSARSLAEGKRPEAERDALDALDFGTHYGVASTSLAVYMVGVKMANDSAESLQRAIASGAVTPSEELRLRVEAARARLIPGVDAWSGELVNIGEFMRGTLGKLVEPEFVQSKIPSYREMLAKTREVEASTITDKDVLEYYTLEKLAGSWQNYIDFGRRYAADSYSKRDTKYYAEEGTKQRGQIHALYLGVATPNLDIIMVRREVVESRLRLLLVALGDKREEVNIDPLTGKPFARDADGTIRSEVDIPGLTERGGYADGPPMELRAKPVTP